MKGNKHGFRRVLAVLLSAMLTVSNLGITAFTEKLTSEPVDAYADEEVFSSYAETPSQDVDILLDDEQPMLISFEMEAVAEEIPEPVAFDQSRTVNGVVVTVKADPGVFPADAVLSVKTVPVYQQQQADAAVDEVRGGNQNVAVSYTFDIKVIHPETGEEYQPAEGQTVSVSFALAEVADENLETQVYHVTEDETTGELAAESLDVNTEITPETGEATTAVVETDGFSIYTVEFTYNNLKYVLPGSTSVPMSEILTAVGLTGEVTAVEVSDASLFSASNETGEWIVTAHQAFDTTERMTVTIGGVTYEITVTDDQEITTWAELQTAIENNNGGTVTLTQSLSAAKNQTAIVIPVGVTVTLNLNNKTLSNNVQDDVTGDNPDCLINVKGTLTLTGDGTINSNRSYGILVEGGSCTMASGTISGELYRAGVYVDGGGSFMMNGGTISGGSDDGVIIYENGQFTMNGGQIDGFQGDGISLFGREATNNSFFINGGTISNNGNHGVYLSEGNLTMSGGTITNNVNYGVYLHYGTTFTMENGKIVDNYNKRGVTAMGNFILKGGDITDKILLAENTIITIGDQLGDTAQYRVAMDSPGVFTSGLSGKGTENNFICDDDQNEIYLNDAGEAVMARAWLALQQKLNAGDEITLKQDFVATAADTVLTVPAGVTVTLDLNGHTIDRNLTGSDAVADGGVIVNNGTMTITDNSTGQTGTITGGNTTGSGGGVYNNGTLTLNGGSITGNNAAEWGGGIYMPNNIGVLNLNGGSITDNTCGNNGGGVHVSAGSKLFVSGAPAVYGNTKNGAANNINLASDTIITVDGALTEGANLCVSLSDGTGTITSGYSTNNTDAPKQFFHADADGNGVLLSGTGEAKIAASVVYDVSYVEHSWSGSAVVSVNKTADAQAVPSDGNMTSGWYYLNGNVTKDGRVESITGDVNLILGDGYKLDVKGLHVPPGSTLTIYGQSAGTGKIKSTPSGGAAIGGYSGHDNGNIVIHGGTIEATGYNNCAGIGSNDGKTTGDITIYGGTITATGGSYGAGIGGGRDCSGGTITIYGGTVTATGKDSSAGIGGGDPSGSKETNATVYIYGGTVKATGNSQGAGIGGGESGHATVTITGGNVTATGGSDGGAGIGNGKDGSGSVITLGYTDTTKATVSISSASYAGTVKLTQPMQNASYLLTAGEVTDNATLTGTLTAWDGTVSTWAQLQQAINGSASDSTITLSCDLTAESTDNALTIPSGKALTIDLNEHTLNRHLDIAAANGGVIVNNGTLIITRGTITGGNTTGNGGGITNSGTLTLENMSITMNSASVNGGGIVNSGTLSLKDCTVSGNTAGVQGGGVWNDGTLSVQGMAIVYNNKVGTDNNNILLKDGKVITVAGELNQYANLNVTLVDANDAATTGTITTGYSTYYGDIYPNGYFHPDNDSYVVSLVDGEVAVTVPYTVTVDSEYTERLSVNKTSTGQGDTVTVTAASTDDIGMVVVTYVDGSVIRTVPFTAGTGTKGTFVMPGANATVSLLSPVDYYDEDGTTKTYRGHYTLVTADTTTWTEGWYVVDQDVTIDQRIEVTGDVHLILRGVDANNSRVLTANYGIHVPHNSASLTVYGEWKEGGGIIIQGNEVPKNSAAIGGNNGEQNGAITINSGKIVVSVSDEDSGAAGIGGGNGGAGSNITINGGIVVTISSGNGASIGGGDSSSSVGTYNGYDITINGGSVNVLSSNGAGIGGGQYGLGYNITINGGNVTARSGNGAGIGGGKHGFGFHITITGGDVKAISLDGGAGIGAGSGQNSSMTFGSDSRILISGGTVTAGSEKSGKALVYGGGVGWNNYYVHIPVGIYDGAKITGGDSTDSTTVISVQETMNVQYAVIQPCDHANPTYEKTSTGHTKHCDDCRLTFSEEEHDYNVDGICTVCGYDSHSKYVFFDSDGGTVVEAQRVDDNGAATQPANPEKDGCVFYGWHLLTNGVMATDTFDFTTPITESITLKASWKHEHDGITFQPWDRSDALPTEAGSYYLTRDVILTGAWDWSSGTLNLCLGGHTVTGSGITKDRVIGVSGGTLNLFDEEGGIITQTDCYGSLVDVSGGAFTLRGGTVSGAADQAGVYLEGGSFTMTGGSVTGNKQGVVVDGGTFSVSGKVNVAGNSSLDVSLPNNEAIQIIGVLDANSRMGVSALAGVFTNGLSGKGDASNFFSDAGNYLVGLNEAGEAYLGAAVTVTFDSDGGSEVDLQTVVTGQKATEPEAPTKEGYAFQGWYQVTGSNPETLADAAFDFDTAITESMTLKAVWEEAAVTYTKVEAKAATYEEAGNSEYYIGSDEKYYTSEDDGATFTEIGENSWIIPRLTPLMQVDTNSSNGVDVNICAPLPEREDINDYSIQLGDTVQPFSDCNPIVIDGTTYYLVKVTCPAKNMADKYAYAVQKNGQALEGASGEVSVRDYADTVIDGEYADPVKKICRAMLAYGASAQTYFNHNTEDPANKNNNTGVGSDYSGVTVPNSVFDKTGLNAALVAANAPVEYAGMSLTFKHDTYISLAFKVTSGTQEEAVAYVNKNFTLGGKTVSAEKNGTQFVVIRTDGISVKNLINDIKLIFTGNGAEYTVNATQYMTLANAGTNENLKNVCKALYNYYTCVTAQ